MNSGLRSHVQMRASVAQWMYNRRERVDWWRWSVLTDINNDPEGLRIPARGAVLIFADLVERGLLVPVQASDGGDAFTINPGKDDEWREIMRPRLSLWKSYARTILGWGLSAVVGGVVTRLIWH